MNTKARISRRHGPRYQFGPPPDVLRRKLALLEAIKPGLEGPSRYEEPEAANECALLYLTLSYLNSTLNFEPTPDFNWRDQAAKAGEYHARVGFEQLRRLVAKGDEKALAALADITIAATLTLSELSQRSPERVRPVARARFFWPFLKAQKERFGDNHKRIVKAIELGHDAPFSETSVSRVRENNVPVKIASKLLCRIESERRKNPAMERFIASRFRQKRLPPWRELAMSLARIFHI